MMKIAPDKFEKALSEMKKGDFDLTMNGDEAFEVMDHLEKKQNAYDLQIKIGVILTPIILISAYYFDYIAIRFFFFGHLLLFFYFLISSTLFSENTPDGYHEWYKAEKLKRKGK